MLCYTCCHTRDACSCTGPGVKDGLVVLKRFVSMRIFNVCMIE